MLVSNRYWSSTFYIGKLRTPWASLMSQQVKNLHALRETWVQSLGWEDPLEKGKATQYSGLENSMDYTVHGAAKSQTRLSDFHFHMVSRDGILLLSRSILPMAVSIVFKEASEKSEFESQHYHLITMCIIYLHIK